MCQSPGPFIIIAYSYYNGSTKNMPSAYLLLGSYTESGQTPWATAAAFRLSWLALCWWESAEKIGRESAVESVMHLQLVVAEKSLTGWKKAYRMEEQPIISVSWRPGRHCYPSPICCLSSHPIMPDRDKQSSCRFLSRNSSPR